jgi:hypothetical protein
LSRYEPTGQNNGSYEPAKQINRREKKGKKCEEALLTQNLRTLKRPKKAKTVTSVCAI